MQNVNLYVPELRPSKEWLSAKSLLTVSVGLVILLIVAGVFSQQQLKRYEKSVETLEANTAAERDSIQILKEKSPANAGTNLDNSIEILKLQVRNLSLVAELIGSQNLGNKEGYSSRLNRLAIESNSNVSISKFRFSQGESKIELAGLTSDPTRLTQFIDALQNSNSFRNAVFGSFTVHKSVKKRNTHAFSFGYEEIFNGDQKLVDTEK